MAHTSLWEDSLFCNLEVHQSKVRPVNRRKMSQFSQESSLCSREPFSFPLSVELDFLCNSAPSPSLSCSAQERLGFDSPGQEGLTSLSLGDTLRRQRYPGHVERGEEQYFPEKYNACDLNRKRKKAANSPLPLGSLEHFISFTLLDLPTGLLRTEVLPAELQG